MLPYMEYVQQAFYKATNWNEDNSYASLNATTRALLDFQTPRGLKLNLSSLSSQNFATSYGLANLGAVDGSVSYLYSSLPLLNVAKSREVDLHNVILGYRQLQELKVPEEGWHWEVWQGGRRVDKKGSLLYGRMYLPTSTLEMLYLRRLSPKRQLAIRAVSDAKLKNGGTILAMLQQDLGRWSAEYLYSTSEGLIGTRALYNFGEALTSVNQPAMAISPPPHYENEKEKPLGRISIGLEMYYGVLNKSGGMSTGIRYTTLPSYAGTPLTMTLTINPIMGHLSATYAIKAGPTAAFCSRFEFNMYSYESDLVLGCELWRKHVQPPLPTSPPLPFSPPTTLTSSTSSNSPFKEPETFPSPAITALDSTSTTTTPLTGCIKARWAAGSGIGLLWEGRIKHLLFSVGSNIDFKRREMPVKSVGVELMYSS